MIKQVSGIFSDYALQYTKIKLEKDSAVEKVKKYYKVGTDLYKDTIAAAEKNFDDLYQKAYNDFREKVQKVFTDARDQLKETISKAPTPETAAITRVIMSGSLSAEEVQIMLERQPLTYGEIMMLHSFPDSEKLMQGSPLRIRQMLDILDKDEKQTFKCAEWYEADSTSMPAASLVKGTLFEEDDAKLEDFMKRYKGVKA